MTDRALLADDRAALRRAAVRARPEKLIDVVGVSMNPPDKAVMLCMDEKSQMRSTVDSHPHDDTV